MHETITLKDFETKYAKYDEVIVTRAVYGNDHPALALTTPFGEPILTASTNLVDHDLGDDELHIKTWSENEGVLEELIKHGVVVDTGRRDPSYHVEAAVCRFGPVWFQ